MKKSQITTTNVKGSRVEEKFFGKKKKKNTHGIGLFVESNILYTSFQGPGKS